MAQTEIHPGEPLAEELGELKMSAAELARKLDVSTNRGYADFERNTQRIPAIRRCASLISLERAPNFG